MTLKAPVSGAGDRQRGLALVVVLWVIAIGSLQVSLFNATVRDQAALAANEAAIARGELLVHAAVELAMARVTAPNAIDRWSADGSERTVGFAGALLHIAITAENARIDINKADPLLLRGLIARLTRNDALAATLVDRIIDWRDADDERSPRGAERGDYGPGRFIGNRPFVDTAELGLVLGMPPELVKAMQPYVTVWSGDERINARSAPVEILRAVPGITDNDLALLMQLKASAVPMAPSDLQRSLGVLQRFVGMSDGAAYRIRVRVEGIELPAIGRAEVVTARNIDDDAPFRVLSWQHEPRGAAAASPGDRR